MGSWMLAILDAAAYCSGINMIDFPGQPMFMNKPEHQVCNTPHVTCPLYVRVHLYFSCREVCKPTRAYYVSASIFFNT